MPWSRAVLLLLLIVITSADQSIRGVDPSRAQYYSSIDGTFKCIDGSKTIPFSRVNDDYCDCVDGSDEPGTAACPSGTFYCQNKGHWPLTLNSSFVDDGICDCCDGTDEALGKCPNKCQELGAEAVRELEKHISLVQAGIQTREKYQRQARRNKNKWQQRGAALDGLIKNAEKLVEEAESYKKEVERKHRKLEIRNSTINSAIAFMEIMSNIKAKEGGGTDLLKAIGKADGNVGGAQEPDEYAEVTNDDAASEPVPVEELPSTEGVSEEQAAAASEKTEDAVETEEERAKRIAAQWIPGADKKGQEEGADEIINGEDEFEGDEHVHDGEFTDEGEENTNAEPVEPEEEDDGEPAVLTLAEKALYNIAHAKARLQSKSKFHAQLAGIEAVMSSHQKTVDGARSKVSAARDSIQKLQSEKTEIDDRLKQDFGPNGVFAPLLGQCFQAVVDKYTYKVCPYGDANQDYTSLGHWGGFDNNYTVMKFVNGQNCWSGPDRSMTVTLKCGPEGQLSKVAEPSRCEYTAELTTAALCSQELLDSLKSELAARRAAPAGNTAHSEL